MNDASVQTRRVFIALWPDEATRRQLVQTADALDGPGRRVPPAHLHLTLAFPGAVAAERVDCLTAGLERLHTRPFRLILDQLGYFAAARVTWVGPSRPPDRLQGLAERAKALCEDCGIELDSRPFVPHVTLRRGSQNLPDDAVSVEPIDWRVTTVALVESGNNGHPGAYRVLARTGPENAPDPIRRAD